jgi:hypothetical protein
MPRADFEKCRKRQTCCLQPPCFGNAPFFNNAQPFFNSQQQSPFNPFNPCCQQPLFPCPQVPITNLASFNGPTAGEVGGLPGPVTLLFTGPNSLGPATSSSGNNTPLLSNNSAPAVPNIGVVPTGPVSLTITGQLIEPGLFTGIVTSANVVYTPTGGSPTSISTGVLSSSGQIFNFGIPPVPVSVTGPGTLSVVVTSTTGTLPVIFGQIVVSGSFTPPVAVPPLPPFSLPFNPCCKNPCSRRRTCRK